MLLTDEREVLISAHRCGAGHDRESENSLAALERALELGVDYVEFDVQRLATGEFVVSHDTPENGAGLPSYEAMLRGLGDRAKAHIDLKFDSPDYLYDAPELTYEVDAARLALKLLGAPDRMVLTTNHVHSVRALQDWAEQEGITLMVGLSLGRPTRGLPWRERLAIRREELFPTRLMEASRANVVCVHHALATLGVRRWAQRRNLPLLVWTVDNGRHLKWWMRDDMAWLVTSNHPKAALLARGRG